MKKTPRETALEVLQACRKDGAWADGSLKHALAKYQLDKRDAALCTRVVYGVLQNRLLLEHYLTAFCSRPLQQLDSLVLDALELGAYQILFLDKVPESAAVNESVELVKRRGNKAAAAMVNAVLRRLAREKNALPGLEGKSITERLSVQYSHPMWLVEEFLQRLGEEETQQLLQAHNEGALLTAQVNPLKTTVEDLTKELSESGVSVHSHPWLEGCLQLQESGNLEKLPAFAEGRFMVQDAAAKVVAQAAGVKPGDRVMDICAAPGGKSFALAMAMENRGQIISCDIHGHKLQLMEKGAQRLGITCMETALADGREFREEWQNSADVVVCDVPCSGLGIIRKKPDIRYKDPKPLGNLPQIQSAILDNACRYVKDGGVLVYSTCTVLQRENEQVVERFLQQHREFEMEAFTLPFGTVPGQITFWPHRHETDGFYICKLRKK